MQNPAPAFPHRVFVEEFAVKFINTVVAVNVRHNEHIAEAVLVHNSRNTMQTIQNRNSICFLRVSPHFFAPPPSPFALFLRYLIPRARSFCIFIFVLVVWVTSTRIS